MKKSSPERPKGDDVQEVPLSRGEPLRVPGKKKKGLRR